MHNPVDAKASKGGCETVMRRGDLKPTKKGPQGGCPLQRGIRSFANTGKKKAPAQNAEAWGFSKLRLPLLLTFAGIATFGTTVHVFGIGIKGPSVDGSYDRIADSKCSWNPMLRGRKHLHLGLFRSNKI